MGLSDLGDSIDIATFEQILEMDDDEDERDFSKGIVYGFFDQAEQTFAKMDKALYVLNNVYACFASHVSTIPRY